MSKAVSVVGNGESSRRNTNALLRDFTQGFEEPTTFVLPVSGPWFTDAVRHVADRVVENQSSTVGLAFIADDHDLPDLSDYEEVTVTEVDDVPEALAQSDTVIVSWFDDTDFSDWVEDVLKAGTTVLDLTDGLYPIEYTPDDPSDAQSEGVDEVVVEPDPAPEPEPQAEPKPKRKSRAAKNAEKTQATADEFYKGESEQAEPDPAADTEAIAQRAAEIVLERLKSALA